MGSSCSLYINNFFALLTLLCLFVSNGDAEATNPYDNHSQNLSFRSRTQHVLLDNESTGLLVENPIRFPSFLSDSGSPDVTCLGHNAGFFKLSKTKGRAGIFYFFFEARQNKKTSPVVIWLNGGPGCSSSMALFNENGPFKVTKNLSLVWNDFGWDQAANILFIDQPIGTGFSYYTDEADIPTTSEEAAVHLYDFLQAFFKKHPVLSKNAFYITGESYAGHYIPAIAARINDQNKEKQGLPINLQGIAIGNGLTNSGVQMATYRDYAKKMKLINKSQYKKLENPINSCLREVNHFCINGTHFNLTACNKVARKKCDVILDTILDLHPTLDYVDIRKRCPSPPCYDFSRMERFLNQTSVKRALGVDVHRSFTSCSDAVFDAMLGDVMRNLAVYIPGLLEDGIKLLLYVGEYDLVCNWLGNLKWVHEMKWSGQIGFNATAYTPFMVDDDEVGSQKCYGNLTFLKIHDAAHFVPMEKPKAALEMLRKWTKGLSPL